MSSMLFGGILGVTFRIAFEHYWTKVLDKGEPHPMLTLAFVITGGALGGLLGAVIKF